MPPLKALASRTDDPSWRATPSSIPSGGQRPPNLGGENFRALKGLPQFRVVGEIATPERLFRVLDRPYRARESLGDRVPRALPSARFGSRASPWKEASVSVREFLTQALQAAWAGSKVGSGAGWQGPRSDAEAG